MIHVICLNPAIDKFYRIDGFAPGEDYPGQMPRCANGGKGVNVARVLARLGEHPMLYGFLGSGARALEEEMRELCSCVFFPVDAPCRTTINILDERTGSETVITETGPRVDAGQIAALMKRLENGVAPGDIVVCSGSLILGAPSEFYARVARLCARVGAKCVLDCNAKTLPASLEQAEYALGKPNERELCALLGEPRTQEPDKIAALAKRLMPPYASLLVSLGAQGGVLAALHRAVYAAAPKVEVVSTVGSGDACLAGAVFAMARGETMENQLRLAMACGASNAARPDTDVGGGADVRALAAQIPVRTLVEDAC